MTNDETLERVRKAFASVIGENAARGLVPGVTMDEIDGWDSMNFIKLVMAIEDEFSIQMNTIEAASLTSVTAVVTFIGNKV